MVVRTGNYICIYYDTDKKEIFSTLDEARQAAEKYCGNNVYNKPFPDEETYLYGPGDGTTSVIIRAEVHFI